MNTADLLVWFKARVKVLLESLPTLEIVTVHCMTGLVSPLCQNNAEHTLKHECLHRSHDKSHDQLSTGVITHLSPIQLDWFELCISGLGECFRVWAMWGHRAVQSSSSRHETLLLCLILTMDQSHELTHAVPCALRLVPSGHTYTDTYVKHATLAHHT